MDRSQRKKRARLTREKGSTAGFGERKIEKKEMTEQNSLDVWPSMEEWGDTHPSELLTTD